LYVNLIHHNSKKNSLKKKCLYLSDLSAVNILDPRYLILLIVSIFSSAGIPPFAGFYAKAVIVLNAEKSYIYTNLSKFLIFLTLFAVFYYVRIIKVFIFEKKKKNFKNKFNTLHELKYVDYNSYVLITFSFILTFSFISINY
jgi:NADH-quinone oxidoreductase subunit N